MTGSANTLALLGGPAHIEVPPPRFSWPEITPAVVQAVNAQLHESVSIYDNSGLFGRFEHRFASYHGRDYGLLFNSGTSALLAMYYGVGLRPGDEVICSAFAFPASVSPLAILGATPRFCPCDVFGNIDPDGVAELVSGRSRAVLAAHMWGIPSDIDALRALCDEYGLLLLEDCSHAHGAAYKGEVVGSFGAAAAWSLQGQKTVSGGEGGILCTSSEDIHARAIALGHYNRRCYAEIPAGHALAPFAATGLGLKLRAHPLGIAMAEVLFDELDQTLRGRRTIADLIASELEMSPAVVLPDRSHREPTWYAFPFAVKEPKVAADVLLRAFRAEGLLDIDRPGGTRFVDSEPLFSSGKEAFSWAAEGTPSSQSIDRTGPDTMFKFPVWAGAEYAPLATAYAQGIRKVLSAQEQLRGYVE